jgi:hypothetical protein
MSTWPRTRDGLQWGTALAVVVVAADLLFAIGSPHYFHFSDVPTSGLMSLLATGQLALLAVWTAFGTAPLLVRLTCLTVATTFCALVATINGFSYEASFQRMHEYAFMSLVIPFPCFLMRVFGFEVVQLHSRPADERRCASRRSNPVLFAQFAGWLAAIMALLPGFRTAFGHELLWRWSIEGAAVAAGSVWAALSYPRLAGRLSMYFAATIGIASLTALADVIAPLSLLIEMMLNAAIPVATLLIFRRLGYRLMPTGLGGFPVADLRENESDDDYRILGEVPLVILLVVAIAVTDVVGVFVVQNHQLLQVCWIGAQACLVAAWAAFGRTPALMRLPLAGVGIAVAVWFGFWGGGQSTDLFTPLMYSAGILGVAAFGAIVMSLTGLRLIRGTDKTTDGGSHRRRFQFSMLQVMIATTEIGILAAALRFAYQYGNAGQSTLKETLMVVVVGGIFIQVMFVSAWLALGRHWPSVRLLVAPFLLWTIAREIATLGASGGYTAQLFRLIMFTAMIAAPLAVFRVCGYRFERIQRGRGMIAR